MACGTPHSKRTEIGRTGTTAVVPFTRAARSTTRRAALPNLSSGAEPDGTSSIGRNAWWSRRAIGG